MPLAATRGLAQGTVPNVCRQEQPQSALAWTKQGCGGETHPHQPAPSPEPAVLGELTRNGQSQMEQGLQPLKPPLCARVPWFPASVDIFFRAQFVTVGNGGAPG